MVQVPVYHFESGEVGTTDVDEAPFGEKIRWRLLRDAVVMYQANRRVGTHSTKTRAEVAGSGKKPWRQKGTGRARSGSRKSPVWRGGGIIFGPKPRDYSYSMPRKALRQALRSAVLGKLRDGEVVVLEGAKLDAPKTSAIAKAFRGLGLTGSALVILPGGEDVLFRSARNLDRTHVRCAEDLNAYDVVTHDRLVFTTEGLGRLVERMGHGDA
jgi:large subunit ribosomal protein L4